MATTPKVLLKRSSIIGRAPQAGDLDYGELALNFADGKIYYKNDQNEIKAFIDSAIINDLVNKISLDSADVLPIIRSISLDSAEVLNLIYKNALDSAEVTRLVTAYSLDSSELAPIIDSDYVQARQSYDAQTLGLNDPNYYNNYDNLYNKPNVLDSADIQDFTVDSGEVINLIDSAYVQARQSYDADTLDGLDGTYYNDYDNLTNKPLILDIVDIRNIITDFGDSDYVQERQDYDYNSLINVPSYINSLDSAEVLRLINETALDSSEAQSVIDSNFQNLNQSIIPENDITVDLGSATHRFRDLYLGPNSIFLGSITVRESGGKLVILDALNNQAEINIDSQVVDIITATVDSSFVNNLVDSNRVVNIITETAFDSAQIVDIVDETVTKSFVDALNVDADTLDGYQAQYFIDKIDSNTASMLDSGEVINLIDSAYVQARTDFDVKFAAKTTDDLAEGSTNQYYLKSRVDSDIAASLNDSVNTVSITVNNVIEDKVDSDYVLARVSERTDSAWIQPIARKGLSGGNGISYDETTGEIVWADSGDINKITFDPTTYTDVNVPDNLPPFQEGNLFYFQGPDALTYSNASINVKLGQDEVVRVYNNTGSDIAKGKAVYVTGASNDFPTIALARADNYNTTYTTIGLTSHTITNGTFGFVTVRGLYGGLNTAAFNPGDIVHVSPDSAGELVVAQPEYPNWPFEMGTVLVADSATGGNVGGCIQVNPRSEIFEGVRVQGSGRIEGDFTVAGNINILGTENKTTVANLNVSDNFIYIGAGDTVTASFTGTGLNDGTFKEYYEGDSDVSYYVRIKDDSSTGDIIEWSFDSDFSAIEGFDSANGPTEHDLGVDKSLVSLRYNIKISFEAATGHTIGDRWYGDAAPQNLDLGIVGNYNTPSEPYTHAGFFRDASDQKFKIFNKYDPEVNGDINTADPSFTLGTMVANTFEGDLTGDVTGTVSDISNHSTTELSEGSNLYYTQARVDSDFDSRLVIKSTTDIAEGTNLYYTSDRVDSDIDNRVTKTFVDALNVDADTLDGQDGSYYLDYTNVTSKPNILDSANVSSIIVDDVDAAYVQARQDFAYASLTGAPTNVSQFTNDAGYITTTSHMNIFCQN